MVIKIPSVSLRHFRWGICGLLACSLLVLAGCSSTPTTPSTTVTPTPPVVVPDPPKLTCPSSQTLQSSTGSDVVVTYAAPTVANGQSPMTVACGPSSGSTFPVGVSTVTCRVSDSLSRVDACSFTVTVQGPPKLTSTSFLAFGDSITWGEDGTVLSNLFTGYSAAQIAAPDRIMPRVQLPLPQIYPYGLQVLLQARYTTQTVTVANAGNPGEAVTYPDTFPRLVRYLVSGNYKVLLLMEGTNDLYTNNPSLLPSVITGLGQMIDAAKSAGVKPYLATIPPMNPAGYRGAVYGNTLVAPLNSQIRALAATKNVPLVDVNAAITNVLTDLSEDGLHPNASGYAKIAQAFFTSIKSTLEVTSTSSVSPTFSVAGARRR